MKKLFTILLLTTLAACSDTDTKSITAEEFYDDSDLNHKTSVLLDSISQRVISRCKGNGKSELMNDFFNKLKADIKVRIIAELNEKFSEEDLALLLKTKEEDLPKLLMEKFQQFTTEDLKAIGYKSITEKKAELNEVVKEMECTGIEIN